MQSFRCKETALDESLSVNLVCFDRTDPPILRVSRPVTSVGFLLIWKLQGTPETTINDHAAASTRVSSAQEDYQKNWAVRSECVLVIGFGYLGRTHIQAGQSCVFRAPV